MRECSVADKEKFTEADTVNVLECVAYGFTEGVEYEAFFAAAKIKREAPAAFCLPDRSENGQIIRVVLKYIRVNVMACVGYISGFASGISLKWNT